MQDLSHDMFDSFPSLGFGGLAGLVVGYTAKKLTKLAALLLGALFIALQLLVYFGFVTVDWGAVEEAAKPALADETLRNQAWEVLTGNLPFAGGFGVGFAIGFKGG